MEFYADNWKTNTERFDNLLKKFKRFAKGEPTQSGVVTENWEIAGTESQAWEAWETAEDVVVKVEWRPPPVVKNQPVRTAVAHMSKEQFKVFVREWVEVKKAPFAGLRNVFISTPCVEIAEAAPTYRLRDGTMIRSNGEMWEIVQITPFHVDEAEAEQGWGYYKTWAMGIQNYLWIHHNDIIVAEDGSLAAIAASVLPTERPNVLIER